MENKKECVFCQIIKGDEPGEKIWENDKFMAIGNKYPKAPVHILVMPKDHINKKELVKGKGLEVYEGLMSAVYEVVLLKGLDKTGYKLVNNGAGYNHFYHEHIHVLGGTKGEPGGRT